KVFFGVPFSPFSHRIRRKIRHPSSIRRQQLQKGRKRALLDHIDKRSVLDEWDIIRTDEKQRLRSRLPFLGYPRQSFFAGKRSRQTHQDAAIALTPELHQGFSYSLNNLYVGVTSREEEIAERFPKRQIVADDKDWGHLSCEASFQTIAPMQQSSFRLSMIIH